MLGHQIYRRELRILFAAAVVLLGWSFGLTHAQSSSQSSAQHVIDSLTALLPTKDDDTSKVRLLISIATKYNRTDFRKAREFANQAKDLSNELGWDKGKAQALTELGMSYYNQEEYEPALDMHLAALDIYLQLKDPNALGNAYNNIANVHSSIGNIELAIENFERSHKIFIDNGLKEQAIFPAHNLASVYSDLSQNQKALDIYFNNLRLIKEGNLTNKRLKAATLNNIGNTMRDMGRCEEALPYLRESEGIKLEMNDKVGLGNSWNNIGCCLIRTGKLQQGEEYVRKALKLGEEINRLSIQEESYGFLSELAEQRGNYKLALEMVQLRNQIQDSIETRNQNDRLTGMQRAYEQNKLDKAEAEKAKMIADAALMQKENSFRARLTLALVVVMALLVVLVVVLLLAFTSRNRNNKALRENGIEIERQRAELEYTNSELRNKNDRLEDLMREKDGLIGIVAHDLKAPLARSAGLASLIGLSGPLSEEQKSYLRMIEKVTDQGQQLIRDLLDLNTIEHQENRMQITAINLSELVAETSASYQGEASKKNITVESEGGKDLMEVRSDRAYLARVLDNLISNAIKFSPKGSTVVVSTGMKATHAVISVKDQGPGLTPEDRKKLYKKFQRLSARPTGGESSTGLGLAITKALVERLQGRIEVVSEPGKGAEFLVHLPKEWEQSPN
jgi:signal transduction histidine kinase